MYKPILAAAYIILTLSESNAQVIRRWNGGKIEMVSKSISFKHKENIFKDFKWTFPDIKSTPIIFNSSSSKFSVGGQEFTITRLPPSKMRIQNNNGDDVTSTEKVSEGDVYYDLANLKLKPVTQQVWTSYTTYTTQSVPVQKSRPVTSYSYQNGRSVPQYRTEYYTAYEYRSVPKMEWRYVPRTTYVYDIPSYKYYSFKLNNGLNFVVYETEGGKYYCQNSSYIIATDDAKINHIFIDVNSNGSFLDNEDKVMFNTWNPYAANAVFKSAGAFMENNWYNLKTLRESNFLSFSVDEQTEKLNIDYENSKYVDENGKGKLIINNLPEDQDLTLFINGAQYKLGKKEVKFKSQYGKFNLRIERREHLDFDTSYVIDEKNPLMQIAYQPTISAAYFTVDNIKVASYFIKVTSENNYTRTYNNRSSITIPAGKSTISFTSDGIGFTKEVNLKVGEGVLFDFEEETKSKTTEEKPTSE